MTELEAMRAEVAAEKQRADAAEADAAALPAMDAECARLRAQVDADRQTIVRLTDELADARDERDRAVKQRDKAISDLDRASGALSGMHERFSFESHKWLGANAHLQAHNDHLVEVNASLKSQVAEAGLCRELIAERDALRAEVERLRPLASAEMQRRTIAEMMNGGET